MTVKLWENIMIWIYPPRCPVCDRIMRRKDTGVCPLCRKEERPERVREPLCKKCGKPLYSSREEFCYDCGKSEHSYEQGRAVFVYRGMEGSVHRFKDCNRRMYAEYYAREMTAALGKSILEWKPQLILPIPLSGRKKRKRGYNQSEILAERLSEKFGIPADKTILCRIRETDIQKSLNDKERKKNMQDAFGVKNHERIRGINVLLVDDVYTTGSTVDAAAKVLLRAGARKVFCVTLCIGKGH